MAFINKKAEFATLTSVFKELKKPPPPNYLIIKGGHFEYLEIEF
jgi:hypothetical protein